MIWLRILCIVNIGWGIMILPAAAQDKIQVVTKTIQRQIPWKVAQKIVFNAEKATIDLQGWNRNEVGITLKLVAKHPNRSVAEQDLSTLRYAIDVKDQQIEFRNFFRITEGRTKVRSNLLAIYEVRIPQNSQISINNRYGNIFLNDWQGTAKVTASFGEVQVNNVQGNLRMDVNYGDILMTQINADVSVDTKKTNITGSGLAGTLVSNSSYGEIDISTQNQLTKTAIDASRTKVSFAATDPIAYYYILEASAGSIQTALPGKRSEGSIILGKDTFESYEHQANQPTVFIKTSYNTININKLEKNAKKTARSTYRP